MNDPKNKRTVSLAYIKGEIEGIAIGLGNKPLQYFLDKFFTHLQYIDNYTDFILQEIEVDADIFLRNRKKENEK